MAGEKKKRRQQKARKKVQALRKQKGKQAQVQQQTAQEARGLMKSLFSPKPVGITLLDLHGLSEADAKETTIKHLRLASANSRHRIVTGRGNHVNAKGKRGTLYNRFPSWVSEIDDRIETVEQHDGYYEVTIKSLELGPVVSSLSSLPLADIQQGADEGDAESQWLLFCHYEYGHQGSDRNEQLAFRWCKAAADQGHPDAMGTLGICYYLGKGARKNDKLAIQWLQSATEAGSEQASLNLGYIYCQKKQYEESFRAYLHAADQHHNSEAQYHVGYFYMSGWGVGQDFARAIYYLELSAGQGCRMSYNALANMYSQGIGVKVDFKRVAHYLKLSAISGDPAAEYLLGKFYYDLAVEDNRYLANALKYLEKSAKKHYGPAHEKLFYHYLFVEQDEEKAAKHLKLSAEMNYLGAELVYYDSHFSLQGVADDHSEKERYKVKLLKHELCDYEHLTLPLKALLIEVLLRDFSSKKAKKLQNKILDLIKEATVPDCFYRLGVVAIRKNKILDAIHCWELGVSMDDLTCAYALGLQYLYGDEEFRNFEKAEVLFQKGTEDGTVCHNYELGLLAYEQFKETLSSNDEDKAEFHFRRAAENNSDDESLFSTVVELFYQDKRASILACLKLGNLLSMKGRSFYDEATVRESIDYLKIVENSTLDEEGIDSYISILETRVEALQIKQQGNIEFKNKNYAEALERYTRALDIVEGSQKIYPRSVPSWITVKFNIGLCYKKLQNFVEAQKYFLAVLQDDEQHFKALLNLADMSFNTGEYGLAQDYAGKANLLCDGSQSAVLVDRLKEIIEGCAPLIRIGLS